MPRTPEKEVFVAESDIGGRRGDIQFVLTRDLKFSTEPLELFAFSGKEPIVCDAMVVAASVEFADAMIKRPEHGWRRNISLDIPVFELHRWESPKVRDSLRCALNFVTGDAWDINFRKRRGTQEPVVQPQLPFPVATKIVMPFSDGVDSMAVAGLLQRDFGDELLRVRVGSKSRSSIWMGSSREFFTRVPYSFSKMRRRESSSRSRGFKFAMIAGLAAYLTKAEKIALPESGQGIFGPVLASVGHSYPDYRNHPQFTSKMERFVEAVLRCRVRYVFPRMWSTKGETLREYQQLNGDTSWTNTVSCWKSQRWSSVNGKFRPCGICAACFLRRVSVHAAGLQEGPEIYVCVDLNAPELAASVNKGFTKLNAPFRNYCIAAIQHLDYLAEFSGGVLGPQLDRHARITAHYVALPTDVAQQKLRSLLNRHAEEWKHFLAALNANSFVRKWAQTIP